MRKVYNKLRVQTVVVGQGGIASMRFGDGRWTIPFRGREAGEGEREYWLSKNNIAIELAKRRRFL